MARQRTRARGHRAALAAVAVAMAIGAAGPGRAEGGDILDTLNSCSTDMKTWCDTVTPGEGRLLACLAAHEDKLSPRCVNALYDGSAPLQALANSFSIIGRSCGADIDRLCAAVEPGEGRIRACLNANMPKVTPACRTALEGLGLVD